MADAGEIKGDEAGACPESLGEGGFVDYVFRSARLRNSMLVFTCETPARKIIEPRRADGCNHLHRPTPELGGQ
jgi:hypothetical protein